MKLSVNVDKDCMKNKLIGLSLKSTSFNNTF